MKRLLMVGVALGACLAMGVRVGSVSVAQAPATPDVLAWQASIGPFTGTASVLVEGEDDAVFAWVGLEVFRSRDDGQSWTRCAGQPYHRSEPALLGRWLLSVGRRLYASGSHNGPMKVSEDECDSWRPISRPPAPPNEAGDVTAVNGVLLAAYSRADFFTSRDGGTTWLPGALPGGTNPRLATRDRTAYLVLGQLLHQSIDNGATWSRLAPNGPLLNAIVPGGRSLYATGSGGIWRSEDGGATWVRMIETALTAITARGPKIYASVFHPVALARSLDDGRTWTRQPLPLNGTAFSLLATRRGTLIAGTGKGIFRSTDDGETWIASGVRGHQVKSLVAGHARAYASIVDGSFWKSDDAGATWSLIESKFVGSDRPLEWFGFRTLRVLDDIAHLRAGTDRELIASDDGGRTWTMSGLSKGVTALVQLKNSWFAGTWQGVFRSEDMMRWTECSSGLESNSIRDVIATSDGDLIALTGYGRLYRSPDDCRSWWPLTAPAPRLSNVNASRTPPLLASDDTLGLVLFGDGIAQLSRDQRAWIVRAESPAITAFARDGQGRYWLGTRDGVSRLSLEEPAWKLIPAGLDGRISVLAIDPDGYLLAAVDGRGMFRARLP
jgi:photosystem II stability/assembly factor-like uncharacterized protein